MPGVKNIIKNGECLDGFFNRINTMRERIRGLEDISTETSKTEIKTGKKRKEEERNKVGRELGKRKKKKYSRMGQSKTMGQHEMVQHA